MLRNCRYNIGKYIRRDERCKYCGSTGAIPEQPKGFKIKEVDEYQPEKVLGCYSQSKAIATIRAIDHGKKGESYILGNEEVTFKEFTKLVAEESGCKRMK